MAMHYSWRMRKYWLWLTLAILLLVLAVGVCLGVFLLRTVNAGGVRVYNTATILKQVGS